MVTNYNTVRESVAAAVVSYSSTLNVYHYVPRSLNPPAAIIQPRPHMTINYMQAQSSGMAKWYFNVLLVIGLVNEQAAQDLAGELISPGSALIYQLQNLTLPNGFAQVTDGSISEMDVTNPNGSHSLYTYAQLAVVITS